MKKSQLAKFFPLSSVYSRTFAILATAISLQSFNALASEPDTMPSASTHRVSCKLFAHENSDLPFPSRSEKAFQLALSESSDTSFRIESQKLFNSDTKMIASVSGYVNVKFDRQQESMDEPILVYKLEMYLEDTISNTKSELVKSRITSNGDEQPKVSLSIANKKVTLACLSGRD